MFFYSSRSIIWSTCLILVSAAVASAQTPETVVATVNNIEIKQKQLDESVAVQIRLPLDPPHR